MSEGFRSKMPGTAGLALAAGAAGGSSRFAGQQWRSILNREVKFEIDDGPRTARDLLRPAIAGFWSPVGDPELAPAD